jgi:hypothetical protein
MPLKPQLWDQLQQHGVTESHLELLLVALTLQRNGSVTWHYAQGHLTQTHLHVVIPPRAREVARVAEVLADGAPPSRRSSG